MVKRRVKSKPAEDHPFKKGFKQGNFQKQLKKTRAVLRIEAIKDVNGIKV